MRKIIFFITLAMFFHTIRAQAPQGITHQAVIRNAANSLVVNVPIGIQVSILQGEPEGTPVYVETHLPNSNANGLITLVIGQGTTDDDISEIDWSDGPYFIKTEADPEGGDNYTITGTSQVFSVPYALYASRSNDNQWVQVGNDIANLNTGNVGIGTTSPTAKFEVAGADALIHGLTVGKGAGRIYSNTAFGHNTLRYNVGGINNTALGFGALDQNTDGHSNTALGMWALLNNTDGIANSAVGVSAMRSNTEGNNNIALGTSAFANNTTGSSGVALGSHALYENTAGLYNIGVGASSLFYNMSGNSNSAFGTFSLMNCVNGNSNTAIGTYSGHHATLNLTGSNNTFLGANTTYSDSAIVNSTAVGADVQLAVSNSVIIGNNANVGIGTSEPASSALLDVSATNKGFLPPRLTTAQRNTIIDPVEGLTIYNKDLKSLEWYTDEGWYNAIYGLQYNGVTDADGNSYQIVKIGNQWWMAENLRTGTMINGSLNQIDNEIIEKYCYNNDPTNCEIYGGLYQWNEMMDYVQQRGEQGICPDGWHVPTDNEWKILEGLVDSQFSVGDLEWDNFGYRGFDAGGNLKESGFTHWSVPNSGATDQFGFSALPTGVRSYDGTSFTGLGADGSFWTSTNDAESGIALVRRLSFQQQTVMRENLVYSIGLPLRCIKD